MRPLVTVPIAIVAGFGAGFFFSRTGAPVGSANEPRGVHFEEATNSSEPPGSDISTDAKIERLLSIALRKGSSTVERDSDLYLLIESLTAADFQHLSGNPSTLKALGDKLGRMGWSNRQNVARALVTRWLQADERAALAWLPRGLDSIDGKDQFRLEILDAFSSARPASVLAIVPSIKHEADRSAVIFPAIQELAVHNLPEARSWLERMTEPEDRATAERALRFGLVQVDPFRAIELAGALTDRSEIADLLDSAAAAAAEQGAGVLRQLATTPMPPWMLSHVIGQLAEVDSAMAVDLAVKAHDDSNDGSSAFHDAFSSLAKHDPALAIAKIEGLSGSELAAAISAIGSAWSASDPAAALSWLAGRPPSERKVSERFSDGDTDVLLHAFGEWAAADRTAARAWADSLPPGQDRNDVQMKLARFLAISGNAAEAIQVLTKIGASANQKVIGDVAGAWARQDPRAAADWAVAQPLGSMQSSALAGVVASWAIDDPYSVQDWLDQFPSGEARDRSIAAFLTRSTSWIGGPTARTAEFEKWFDRIDDPWRRAQAATSLYWTKRESDPEGARAWLASLPNLDPGIVRTTLRR